MYVYIDKDKVVLSCGVVSSLINQLNLIKKKKKSDKKKNNSGFVVDK